MKKVFMWMVLVALAVSLVVVLPLSACKKETVKAEPAEAAEEKTEEVEEVEEEKAEEVKEEERAPVTLEFWTVHAEDNPQHKAFKRAAEIVKEKYNITVNVVSKGNRGFRELLTASAMSQSGPDIMFNWSGLADIVTSGRQGLYLPLNDYLTQDEIDSLAGLSSCTDQDTGDIYGVIYAYNYIALAYNKAIMDEVGIDYNSFPSKWTYDEFLNVCDKLKTAGVTPFAFGNLEGFYSDWWHSFFLPTYVDKIEDVIPIYQETPIYKEPFITFCKNWKDFYDKGYYLEGGNTVSIGELWGQFINEDAALGVTFPSITSMYIEGMGQEKVGLIEFPAMGNGELSKANPIFGDCMGVTNWTEHPEEAVLYIKTLIFDPEMVKMFADMGNLPVCNEYKMSDFPIENPEVARFFENHEKMPTYFEGHAFWVKEYSEATRKFCNMMLMGEISIEDYAQEIENAITQ